MPLIYEKGPRTVHAKGYFPSKNCKSNSIRSLFLAQELSLATELQLWAGGRPLNPFQEALRTSKTKVHNITRN